MFGIFVSYLKQDLIMKKIFTAGAFLLLGSAVSYLCGGEFELKESGAIRILTLFCIKMPPLECLMYLVYHVFCRFAILFCLKYKILL